MQEAHRRRLFHQTPYSLRAHARKTNAPLIRITLILALIASLIPLFPNQKIEQAWADDEWAVGMTFSGTCWIGPYTMAGGQSYFTMSGFDGKLGELAIGTQTFECINHTAANPYEQTAPYTATVIEIDEAGGRVKFNVTVEPAGATDGTTSNEFGLIGYQRVGGTIWANVEFKGKIDLQKSSSNEKITENNSMYSLEGAQYGIFNDANCTTTIQTLTTNSSGYAISDTLRAGTYYVKEIVASPGYTIDNSIYTVVVKPGRVTRVNNTDVKEIPQTAYIDLQKKSTLPQITDDNSQYSLADAQYKIYNDSTLKTEVDLISTNDSGYAKSNPLPLGTYFIKETKAPVGYQIDETIYEVLLTAGGQTARVNNQYVYDSPITNPAIDIVSKKDSETEGSAAGGASFAGAQFSVKYYSGQYSTATAAQNSGKLTRTWVLQCDQNGEAKLDDAYLVEGDDLFKDKSGKAILPLGTITVQETKAPSGYHLNDVITIRNITTDTNNQTIAEFNPITGSDAVAQTVFRGDLKLVKAREYDQQRLAGIPFKITSQTTGEWHIAVTDENGFLDTSSSWNSHKSNTNTNDAALKEDGSIDESMLDAYAGIWFGSASALTDQKGALIYDVYTIEELRVQANKGLELVNIKNIFIKRDGITVDLGTVDNQSNNSDSPWIKTIARDAASGEKTAISSELTTLIDRVEFFNLPILEADGTTINYTLKTTLFDKTTGEPLVHSDGSTISTLTDFTPNTANGYIEASITFDASILAGQDVVFFEELYKQGSSSPIAEHNDINDYEQTIRIQTAGNLHTVARNALDGTNTAAADTSTTLIDRVYYSGLLADGITEYRLHATLMDAATNDAIKDNNADPISAIIYFTPSTSSGYVDVEITFDAHEYAGQRVVFFEELYKGNSTNIIAAHKDINDYYQTITLKTPEIQTYAIDKSSNSKVMSATDSQYITDTITYSNLVAGKKYDVLTTVKERNFVVGDNNLAGTNEGYWVACDIDDSSQLFTKEWSFIAENTNGSAAIDIAIDTSEMAGKSLVVYQEIRTDNVVIAQHKDAASDEQSIFIQAPAIISNLHNASTSDKTIRAQSDTHLIDSLSYSNLQRTAQYTTYGMLIDPDTLLPHLKNNAQVIDTAILSAFMYDLVNTFGDTSFLEESNTPESQISQSNPDNHADKTDAVLDFSKTAEGLEAIFNKYPRIKESLVLSSHTFIADNESGTTELTYELDSSHLSDKTLTSIIILVKNSSGKAETTEHDLTNPYQSVKVVAEAIATEAFGKPSLDKSIPVSDKTIITDKVTYTNLEVGQNYVLEGELYDKETESPLFIKDSETTASTEFNAITENGTAFLDFEINTSELEGKSIVVYERLYKLTNDNGWPSQELVATHEDISSYDQTVTVETKQSDTTTKSNETSGLATTGDRIALTVLFLMLGSAFFTLIAKRRKNN